MTIILKKRGGLFYRGLSSQIVRDAAESIDLAVGLNAGGERYIGVRIGISSVAIIHLTAGDRSLDVGWLWRRCYLSNGAMSDNILRLEGSVVGSIEKPSKHFGRN